MTDSKKLKAKIVENGLTQEELAEKLNISPTSLNNKINNKFPFNSDEMFRISDILKIKEPREIFFASNSD